MLDFNQIWYAYMSKENFEFVQYWKKKSFTVRYFNFSKNDSSTLNVNLRNEDGDTPLHVAAVTGDVRFVTALLECTEIECNPRNNKNETPIDTAARGGNLDVVEALLKCKEVADSNLEQALENATQEGHAAVVEAINNHNNKRKRKRNDENEGERPKKRARVGLRTKNL